MFACYYGTLTRSVPALDSRRNILTIKKCKIILYIILRDIYDMMQYWYDILGLLYKIFVIFLTIMKYIYIYYLIFIKKYMLLRNLINANKNIRFTSFKNNAIQKVLINLIRNARIIYIFTLYTHTARAHAYAHI